MVLTHLLAVGLGYLMGRYFTNRALHSVFSDSKVLIKGEPAMSQDRRLLGLWIIVAATILIGIGAQSLLAQHATNELIEKRDANFECLNRWSNEFTYAITQRSSLSDEVAQAQRERENSLDSILVLVYQSSQKEGSVTDSQYAAALEDFVNSRQNLADARDAQSENRENVPYPDPPAVFCEDTE